jgi:hypothetical protein
VYYLSQTHYWFVNLPMLRPSNHHNQQAHHRFISRLTKVLSPATMQTTQSSGRMVFHVVGDTGGVKSPQDQDIVAAHMKGDIIICTPCSNYRARQLKHPTYCPMRREWSWKVIVTTTMTTYCWRSMVKPSKVSTLLFRQHRNLQVLLLNKSIRLLSI